jgi:hypothetical protein
MPYLACLGHPLFPALVLLMISVMLVSWANTPDCLFSNSMSHAEKAFDLMHLDLWTSPVVSVSSSKYYMVILDDFTHYLWTFPLKLKSDTFTTLSNFVAYVATQFSCTIKAIQCDNGHEFNNSSTWTFLLSKGTQLWMSCPYTSPQNSKSERIIHSINNVIHTLLI